MNGLEKTQLQIERGTRPIVEGVDQLRLHYGFDKVVILTPIVETRLRSGLMAVRPLKAAYQTCLGQVQVILTVHMTYPKTAIDVEVSFNGSQEILSIDEVQYNESLLNITAVQGDDGNYINAKEVLDIVMNKLRNDFQASFTEGNTTDTVFFTDLMKDIEDDKEIGDEPVVFYLCRRCRCCLFDSTAFQDHSKLRHAKCSSLFLEEPPATLVVKDHEQEGKLNCPKCDTRVGQWSWIGSKCSCGEWITPAYQYTKSKLDESKI